MTVSEQKQAQRRAGRTARRALSAQARAAANAALCANLWQLDAVQNAQTILLYAAFGSEADLSAFAEKAQAQGKTLAYPVCGEAYSLTAAVPGPDGWEVGQYGIRTPILSRSEILLPEALDLILVPIAFFRQLFNLCVQALFGMFDVLTVLLHDRIDLLFGKSHVFQHFSVHASILSTLLTSALSCVGWLCPLYARTGKAVSRNCTCA